jgi:hypothetical protein
MMKNDPYDAGERVTSSYIASSYKQDGVNRLQTGGNHHQQAVIKRMETHLQHQAMEWHPHENPRCSSPPLSATLHPLPGLWRASLKITLAPLHIFSTQPLSFPAKDDHHHYKRSKTQPLILPAILSSWRMLIQPSTLASPRQIQLQFGRYCLGLGSLEV